jgi:membrane protease YdiL (CAAX protease family)
MYPLLLLCAVAICIQSAVSGRTQYRRFAKLKNSGKRVAKYRRWITESWVYLGLFAVAAMLLSCQRIHLLHPLLSDSLSYLLRPLQSDPSAMGGFITGAVAGLAAIIAVAVVRARRGQSAPSIGNYAALLPRNRTEGHYGVALAVTAAFNEELFFRAMLPVLLLGTFHNVQLAVWGSVVLFAGVHYYQGWQGLLGTFVIGAILMQMFMFSGTILAPMAAHALIDLNSLVALPALAAATRRNRKAVV